jgi:hypothetical protein
LRLTEIENGTTTERVERDGRDGEEMAAPLDGNLHRNRPVVDDERERYGERWSLSLCLGVDWSEDGV